MTWMGTLSTSIERWLSELVCYCVADDEEEEEEDEEPFDESAPDEVLQRYTGELVAENQFDFDNAPFAYAIDSRWLPVRLWEGAASGSAGHHTGELDVCLPVTSQLRQLFLASFLLLLMGHCTSRGSILQAGASPFPDHTLLSLCVAAHAQNSLECDAGSPHGGEALHGGEAGEHVFAATPWPRQLES